MGGGCNWQLLGWGRAGRNTVAPTGKRELMIVCVGRKFVKEKKNEDLEV